jgi:hypothetical protein
MGRLADINAQLEAYARGESPVTTESRMDDHVKSIVEAVRGIQLNIDSQEGYDYTPEIQKLGEAVTQALKAHGNALVKALGGISVNVEAPSVTVEPPSVSVEAPVVNFDTSPVTFHINRDADGLLRSVDVRPYEPPKPTQSTVEME